MENLIGFLSILIVSLFVLFLSFYAPSIKKILFLALTIRFFFLFLGYYFIDLPDSTADALTFERSAWIMSQKGFFDLLNHFEAPSDQFFSWLIAVPYSLFGRNLLMIQSISIFFGMCNIYLGWKLALRLWGIHVAQKTTWVIAFFPSLILYSVLVMREVYICFFLLLAFNSIFSWFKNKSFQSYFLSIFWFLIASLFHGGMILGALVFIGVTGFTSIKKIFKDLLASSSINYRHLIILLILIINSWLFFTNKIYVPKLGYFENIVQLDTVFRKINISTRGDASYPEWTKVTTLEQLIYKLPIRAAHFLFSPFPWQINKIEHLFGLIDGLLYVYLVFIMILNRHAIHKNPTLKLLLLILIVYVFAFCLGTGNFGTSIRHRSKFLIILVLLSAPLIKKVILFKKNNFSN